MGDRFSTINLLNSSNTVGSNVNIDSNTLFVDGANNRIGIGTITPNYPIEIRADSNTVTSWVASVNRGATGTAYGAGFLAVTNNTSYGILAQRANDGVFILENAIVANVSLRVAGNERITINSSGPINIPYQPAFWAYGSGTQSWTGAQQNIKVNFASGGQYVGALKSGGWSQSNSRFTAPVAGTYEFTASFALSASATTGPAAVIYKNGAAFQEVAIGYYSTTYCQCTGNVFMDLSTNDYVELYIGNFNSTTFTIDLARTRFSGRLIG